MPDVRQLLPSGRSLALGLLLVVLAAGAYLAARETSLFAVRTLDVRGGTPALRAQVRSALAGELGTSLLGVDGPSLARRLDTIPGVRSFTYDRAFPNTLKVVLTREIPVLVVRRVPGNDAFLVAASGKVIGTLPNARLAHYPRLWVKADVALRVGADVPAALAGAPMALAAVRGSHFPARVAAVLVSHDELTLVLGSGFQIRLGDAGDGRLKLAIARRILAATGSATAAGGYLDVSLPERPVLDTNSRVGG